MAENKQINIDINTNSKETQAEFERLRKAIKASTEEVEDLSKKFGENSKEADVARKSLAGLTNTYDEMSKVATDLGATFEDIYDDLQPLTTRLGEAEDRLYELAAAGQTTTQEYKDLLQTVANYRKIQIQTDAVVDAASTRFDEKLGGALQGAASGFAGVQGAMALFGNESEELEKTLVKLQGAMALSEGVRGIREGITSFNALATQGKLAFQGLTTAGKLFAVTGIGALVTGVAYLMGAFDDATESVNKYASAQKTSNDIQQKAIEDSAEELSALNKLQTQINDETLTREQKNLAVKKLQDAYPDLLKNVNAEKLSIGELNKAVVLNIKLAEARARVNAAESLRAEKYQKILKEELVIQQHRQNIANTTNENSIAMLNEQISRTQRVINGYKEEISQIDGITKADEALIAKVEEQTKVYETEKPKVIKQVKEVANYTRQLEKEQIDAMEDGMQKRIALLEFQRQEELKGIDKNGKKAGELRKAIEARYLKEIEKVRYEFRDRSDRDDEIVLEKKRINLIEIGKQEIDAEKYVQSEIARLRQEETDKEIQRRKDLLKATTDIALQGLDLIASIAEANAGKDEKRQRAAFNIRKASNIAQATVDGYKAVLSTYADTPGGVVIKTIAATIAGGFAALKIGQIAKSKYESSASGGGGGDLASGGTESFAPQFNVIGNSGINQLAQLQQQPVQAYVVSGEVTSAQALDRNRQKNATL